MDSDTDFSADCYQVGHVDPSPVNCRYHIVANIVKQKRSLPVPVLIAELPLQHEHHYSQNEMWKKKMKLRLLNLFSRKKSKDSVRKCKRPRFQGGECFLSCRLQTFYPSRIWSILNLSSTLQKKEEKPQAKNDVSDKKKKKRLVLIPAESTGFQVCFLLLLLKLSIAQQTKDMSGQLIGQCRSRCVNARTHAHALSATTH